MNNYYVVWVGRVPGVYNSWNECLLQVDKFPGARYRKVKAKDIAEANLIFKQESPNVVLINNEEIKTGFLSVDGASNGKVCEYRAVWVEDKKVAFASPKYEGGTNNIAEFLGLVHACEFLKEKNIPIKIYTDSVTALSWFKNKEINTTADKTGKLTLELENLLLKAQLFLYKNEEMVSKAEILKWDTKEWGEIPADYGRK